mmetsp:Transcript_12601/g.31018  ORF Transcript_12601/g.31018 Transcript_12601/m.31018 type:complete len:441 (-) Transcript_12601:70-1392(-)|eukprot:CAMPEP_0198308908 /NCGR_PEP_ID=MMETSP1450-20131203/1411_1 /TAXON_ID=753684 ORGANISM="Madagascaria erythrocladiodes, Strain CCMP3234" /NCGR_SAMPLE_ID=MMETSP1450 /ASSEMBLY_ACC=CAM_ASM_001115 /LENGTH=440 /DNA_ID=CAMNT_0044011625 /DNA_START=62 /DNA_END=1384 /DNA_ORIENTATION=-
MLSGIFVLSGTTKGETIIARLFRGDVDVSVIDAFKHHLLKTRELRSPIWRDPVSGVTFMHVRFEDVVVVAATNDVNADVALVFELLYSIVDLFVAYFGFFDEACVKDNFVLVQGVLDETIDYGYPQHTDVQVLGLYVAQKSTKNDKKRMADVKRRLADITGAVSWREQGIKYKRNEIFIDVIERVNVLLSPKGDVLESDVTGSIQIKAFLSGMPECRFGMNDKVLLDKEASKGGAAATAAKRRRKGAIQLDDTTFHQCVKLSKFDSERVVSFVPPDGEFQLMSYRTTSNINLPFRLLPIVKEIGTTRVEYKLSIKANFGEELLATGVLVKVPVPKNTATTKMKVSNGKTKYVAQENAIVWKIPRMAGGAEYHFSADVSLMATISKKAWSRPPITLAFNVPMFAASGLNIRYLKVLESRLNYETTKWVRYATLEGEYAHRM